MKKFISLFLILILVFSLIGCKGDSGNTSSPLPEGFVQVNHLIFELPEGFRLIKQSGITMAVRDNYPTIKDSISFSTAGKDSPDLYTKEALDRLHQATVEGFSSSEELKKESILGYDVIIYNYGIEGEYASLVASEYIIFGDDFTDTVRVTIQDPSLVPILTDLLKTAKIAE